MDESAPGAAPFEALRDHFDARVDGVSDRIADGEEMFRGKTDHYRNVGQSAWRCVAMALIAASVAPPRRILDLPCGHGRVLRVLRKTFPDADFTACDLLREGVDFCAREFGATPVYSHEDISRVQFAEPFDLIWCGSLVTHLDQRGWLQTFQLFLRSLRPSGIAVISFHGRWPAYRMRQGHDYNLSHEKTASVLQSYDETGFGYADYDATPGYGISLSAPSWVLRELESWHQLRVVMVSERLWDQHHDVIAVQRLPDDPGEQQPERWKRPWS